MNSIRPRMRVVHLTASPFFGGPERQMLGLACAMSAQVRTTFLCLMEKGMAMPFVEELRGSGQEAIELKENHPHLIRSAKETAARLRELRADVLLTHGYKADIIGYLAARFARVPLVVVSRGWTWATRKVRLYEAIDRMVMRHADHVVCVSEGQAQKVRRARVSPQRVSVIRNSINASRFAAPDEMAGEKLRRLFVEPPKQIVLAVGRLSPEKGFDYLIQAAARVCAKRADVGFALIGSGPLERRLQQQILQHKLHRRFVLCGFRNDVDQLLPHATLLVQSSHTEGMPNVILEAMAASVPVVATAVGGTAELVIAGETGVLVPAGDANALAEGMLPLLDDSMERARVATAARHRVEEEFSFTRQASEYERLLMRLLKEEPVPTPEIEAAARVQA